MNIIKSPKFNVQGELEIVPSINSSQNDFNFLVGEWEIKNRKLKTRLNNCQDWIEFEATGGMRKIINGIGNIDDFITIFEGKLFEGMSLRLFNPKTKLWSIYWADSNGGVLDIPVVGSFENNIGYFFAKDIFQGEEIIVVFRWDATDSNNPIWSQAFSNDQGKCWEWNWYMYMTKIKKL